ncbi:hypothetical protein HQQ80_19995 [Microbacteriaceae bacterium VKM Ac-2855]|nr:hypothetical protein [Microbacteriaceae bacterium VKM Ac-2855]
MTMPSFPIDPAADREPFDKDEPPTLAQTEGDDPIEDEFTAENENENDELEPQAQVPPLN